MRVFIAGIDGYLGWSLAQVLAKRGHIIAGCDNGARRIWVNEIGSQSAIPILEIKERKMVLKEHYGSKFHFIAQTDLTSYEQIEFLFMYFKPEVIVHFGEMPSAPYSMIDADHACYSHTNNLIGTLNILWLMRDICPDAHLVKLGTMGEYGTPNIDIPEGYFEIEFRGRWDWLPFPRQPGSFYHLTKVHDTNNIMFACKMWGLRATDIMQGVVYGTRINEMGDDPRLLTRFDFDQCFGTAINRFCSQAVIGHPLTPYGTGKQTRGYLPLKDSMQCLTLVIENPPPEGHYRVLNQFENIYTINELAQKVKSVGNTIGLDVKIANIENPRKEAEDHYYNPDHKYLFDLGYIPSSDMESEILVMLNDLLRYSQRIKDFEKALLPSIRWDGTKKKCKTISEVV